MVRTVEIWCSQMDEPSTKTAELFAARSARADLAKFDRLMVRKGGQPPQEGDEVPKGYRKSRSR